MERTSGRTWIMRAAFVGLALFVLFANLLPLQTTAPTTWAGVDFLMVFALAWSVRRPDYVPTLLLALVFLLADLLLQRPPGLWALLLLLACERLKSQSLTLRDAGLPTELLTVAVLITGIYMINRLVLAVLLVDVAPLGLYALQLIATLVAYPVAIFITHAVLGVRKIAATDMGPGGIGT